MRIAVFSALLPFAAVPTAGAASVPPTPSPATVLTLGPFTFGMNQELQGSLCQSSNTCVPVVYVPFFTAEGVIALDNTLADTTGNKIIVFGYSNGAEVAEQWLVQNLNNPNAPSPDVLSFVVIGNPTNPYFGSNALAFGEAWPASRYQVIDVARQYDGVADFPNNPASPYYLLAVVNADVGFLTLHLDYTNVNINAPANAVWTVGNTTYVLVPTQTIPLLIPLQALGFNVDAVNALLKPLIDQAYTRTVPFPTTSQPAQPTTSPAADSVPSTPVVSDPAVAPQHTTMPLSLATAPLSTTTATAPTPNRPKNTINIDTGPAAADTVTTPALPAAGEVLGQVETITPRTAQAGLDTPLRQSNPTTSPTTHAPTERKKAVTGEANGMRAGIASRLARSTKAG